MQDKGSRKKTLSGPGNLKHSRNVKFISFFVVILLILSVSAMGKTVRASGTGISWTEEERLFMEEHPVIQIGADPGFVPFEFIDEEGEYKGIAADYLALVAEKTGLRFEVVKDLTWPEAYDKALEGEIDALSAIGKTAEREEHFIFSKAYYDFKRVLVTRDSDTSISGIKDLEGLIVAVQRNSSHYSYLLTHPKINLSLYDSVEGALTAVATGSEKVFVGNLATTNYLIRTNGLPNLRFVSFEAEKQQSLFFAVRKDFGVLAGIFDKAMDSITESEKMAINRKWIDLDTEIDYGPMIRVLAMVGTLIAVVLSVSFYWIMRLRKEIRQRKAIQKDLEEAKAAAEEANEFKSSFMARMSHEIRTPLNAITGMTYLMKKTSLTVTQKIYADRITQASSNMLSIINDILDYSKIEAGKVELESASFSMDQVIQNVVNIVSYKIEEQEIGFRLSKDPLVPNWFFGDAKRLEQVLLNVLNNAAKFTSKGEVSLDIRLIAKEKDQYHISFTVKDTGIGMDEDQVEKLFEPFTQGDSSITRRFGGSGLGLSIVRNLLEMMGGKIQAFSTPGEGTTFIIQMSLNVDKEKEEGYIRTLSGDYFKSVRTLVLEKSGANMNLIESYLSAFGMQCELTTSQSSALSMLEAEEGRFAHPFDLFIIDYETPAEGGFEFVEAIRRNKKIINKPRIIMLLPMMREDLFDRIDEYGIEIGIGKPIIPSVLFNGILDIFELKAVSSVHPESQEEVVLESENQSSVILIVDDNKTNQLIAKSLLQQNNMRFLVASDGQEALEMYNLHQEEIDLILMDLHMPVMNGYDAAVKIRETSSTVPIVAMTADVILGVKEKCAKSGIHHYISKPFDPDQFIMLIRGILNENQKEDPQDKKMLDAAAGLKSMGGNGALYQEVLEAYYNENLPTLDRLSQAIEEKRYKDAAQIVHKVKSSSGSIGAKILYELSMKLQRALEEKEEEQVHLHHRDYRQKFRKLLTEISEYQQGERT